MALEAQEFEQKAKEKVKNAGNQHEVLSALADTLEVMLENVNRQMPKEEFRNIDNTPKPLLYQTEEDMKAKPPAVLRDELNELIKEAKSKIKPVDISDAELARYITPKHQLIEGIDGKINLSA